MPIQVSTYRIKTKRRFVIDLAAALALSFAIGAAMAWWS